MRDFEKLVKKLRYCSKPGNCNLQCPRFSFAEDCLGKLTTDAADAIEEMLAAVPNWISVEERLPKDSGYTIVFCADGDRRHVTFAKYLKTPKRWELNGARNYWRVLKWMPLPEPPKEESK